jgi:hypothetical protein
MSISGVTGMRTVPLAKRLRREDAESRRYWLAKRPKSQMPYCVHEAFDATFPADD